MSEINKPDLTNQWASLGPVLEPDPTKVGLGWQEGESPLCEWQNWWQHRADLSLSYLYQKGVPEWDASTEYIANRSIVNYQGNLYLCTTTNTNNLPTNASFWKRTGLALSDIPSASTSVKGIVQLNDTLSSTSTSLALTAKQGKALNDSKVSTTTTVNGKALSGNISLTKTDVGLGNVDDVKQLPNSYLDTSGTLASNSDVKVPSQKAVKTYADTKLSKASNLSDVANTATARTNLGLTSAATTEPTANNLDTTVGRLLKVGDFGVGAQINIPDAADLNDYKTPGNYGQYLNSAAVNGTNYPIPFAGVLIVERSGANGTAVIQRYTKFSSSESYTRSYSGSIWSPWDRTVTEAMTGTAYTRNYTTSTTLAGNSDSNVPTEKATKTYVDNSIQTNVKNYGLGVPAVANPGMASGPNGFYFDADRVYGGNFVIKYTFSPSTYPTYGFALSRDADFLTKFYLSAINTAGTVVNNEVLHTGNTTNIINKAVTTSTTLAGNSDSNLPTERAVKTYVDTKVSETPFRNRLINGNFSLDVYNGGSETTVSANHAFVVNRWRAGSVQVNKLKTQRITSGSMPRDVRSYLRVKVASAVASPAAGDYFDVKQEIEGTYFYDFNFGTADATPITLSFMVRCSVAGTYSISLRNDSLDRSYVSTYTINSANTWEIKSITIPGETTGSWPNDVGRALSLAFNLGGGSTYTTSSTNTWLSGNYLKASSSTQFISNLNATFDITNVQFEKGSVASSYEAVDPQTNLLRCGRYYQICYANTRGYAPSASFSIETPIAYRTLMRTVPTASIVTGTRVNTSSVVVGDPGIYGARHVLVSAAAGEVYAIRETAIFDAEL